ncbi:hypothetical protein [Comamonas thiooxydans]|uniref:hypothetical protein n=1 Tax=Comamonas thiooxydans TaxID=363952 RepID=UPI0010397E36|nr:hypothetical protein [Comamonas thiooxydans]
MEINNSPAKLKAYMLSVIKNPSSEINPALREVDSTAVPIGDFVYCPAVYEARLRQNEQEKTQVRIKKSRQAQRSNATE